MAANYTKRDERNAEIAHGIAEHNAYGWPAPKVWTPLCCVCSGTATLEVNKFSGVKFYCEACLPAGAP